MTFPRSFDCPRSASLFMATECGINGYGFIGGQAADVVTNNAVTAPSRWCHAKAHKPKFTIYASAAARFTHKLAVVK
jgi:hypothetical protein